MLGFKKTVLLTFFMSIQIGCTVKEPVYMDIDTFVREQAAHVGADVVITATLEDVLSRYPLYRGKKIQLSAPADYFGTAKFWTWYILLKEEDRVLRCYTRYYRIKASNHALNLLRRARSKKEAITVTGVLRNDGIDIEKIYHDGVTVRPDIHIPGIFTDDILFRSGR